MIGKSGTEVSVMNGKELAGVLYKSKYTVCISGREMIVEDGIDSMRNLETAYEIETKYGYSPEEVSAPVFLTHVRSSFMSFTGKRCWHRTKSLDLLIRRLQKWRS